MSEEPQEVSLNFTELAAEIVSAYVSNNPVPPADLPALIARVHQAVSGLATTAGADAAAPGAEVEKPTPAQIRKSVRPDGIVSFIDGKTYKTLKRHLTSDGLNPRSYRDRYGLPADYPMTASSCAAQSSALAKAIGLGQRGAMAVGGRKGRKAA
ncbi:MucR family transcriptional regulator [Methylobacterium brachiatum]|uniref:MucR family transcriptional regulator n=1 Tax=Methylobacterium brachiatum TaxID=269660 RepID=UPI0024486A5B|nr:MucR family transcriptional regulator [Methylobacterium brachiatum]MDH2312371.1 MucR family transcriptional regulator [Methylobacterium brachiatum]